MRLWLMWECRGVEQYPLHHGVRLKVHCFKMYKHSHHLHPCFLPSKVNTTVPTGGLSTTCQLRHPSSDCQSICLSLADANQLWQIKLFTHCTRILSILPLGPSILLNLQAHILSIYLHLLLPSVVPLSSHAVSVGDIEETNIFLSDCFSTRESSLLNDSVQQNDI